MLVNAKENNKLVKGVVNVGVGWVVVGDSTSLWDWYSAQRLDLNLLSSREAWLSEHTEAGLGLDCRSWPWWILWIYNCRVHHSMTSKGKLAISHHLNGFCISLALTKCKHTVHPTVKISAGTLHSFLFFRPFNLNRHSWLNSRHPSWFYLAIWTQLLQSLSWSILVLQETMKFKRKNTTHLAMLSFSLITVQCREPWVTQVDPQHMSRVQ